MRIHLALSSLALGSFAARRELVGTVRAVGLAAAPGPDAESLPVAPPRTELLPREEVEAPSSSRAEPEGGETATALRIHAAPTAPDDTAPASSSASAAVTLEETAMA
jgi:hypothetical protein